LFLFKQRSADMPSPAEALPGRETPLRVNPTHHVNGSQIVPPYPDGSAAGDVRRRLLLGRREDVLADARA
jgi:hypothetical protein